MVFGTLFLWLHQTCHTVYFLLLSFHTINHTHTPGLSHVLSTCHHNVQSRMYQYPDVSYLQKCQIVWTKILNWSFWPFESSFRRGRLEFRLREDRTRRAQRSSKRRRVSPGLIRRESGSAAMFYPNENNSRVRYEAPGNRWLGLMKMEAAETGKRRRKGSLSRVGASERAAYVCVARGKERTRLASGRVRARHPDIGRYTNLISRKWMRQDLCGRARHVRVQRH